MKYIKPKYKIGDIVVLKIEGEEIGLFNNYDRLGISPDVISSSGQQKPFIFQMKITDAYFEDDKWKYVGQMYGRFFEDDSWSGYKTINTAYFIENDIIN